MSRVLPSAGGVEDVRSGWLGTLRRFRILRFNRDPTEREFLRELALKVYDVATVAVSLDLTDSSDEEIRSKLTHLSNTAGPLRKYWRQEFPIIPLGIEIHLPPLPAHTTYLEWDFVNIKYDSAKKSWLSFLNSGHDPASSSEAREYYMDHLRNSAKINNIAILTSKYVYFLQADELSFERIKSLHVNEGDTGNLRSVGRRSYIVDSELDIPRFKGVKTDGDPIAFLNAVKAGYEEAGRYTRAAVANHDPALVQALYHQCRKQGLDPGSIMPPATKEDLSGLDAEQQLKRIREQARARTARYRDRRLDRT